MVFIQVEIKYSSYKNRALVKQLTTNVLVIFTFLFITVVSLRLLGAQCIEGKF